jgi:putative transposase
LKKLDMAGRKMHSVQQMLNLLRQIEVDVANVKKTVLACNDAEITEQAYSR